MDRSYVVTGAASGIGLAVASRLRSSGAEVIGVDLRGAEVLADLATPDGRAAAVEAVARGRDSLDAVIACAGLATPVPAAVSVNYFGVVEVLEGLLPLLQKGRRPRAVAVTSVAALHPGLRDVVGACMEGDEPRAVRAAETAVTRGKQDGIYSGSKVALSRWIRRSAPTERWAGHGVALNGVGPGVVITPMMQEQLADPEQRAELTKHVPMPLCGPIEAADVAALIDWLAGEDNVAVTGQCIYVDGGADAVLRGDEVW